MERSLTSLGHIGILNMIWLVRFYPQDRVWYTDAIDTPCHVNTLRYSPETKIGQIRIPEICMLLKECHPSLEESTSAAVPLVYY